MEIICINSKFSNDVLQFYAEHGVKIPQENKIYTLREKKMHSNGKFGVLLEEIVNPLVPIASALLPDGKIEPTFDAKRFTDLLGNDLVKHDEQTQDFEMNNINDVKQNNFYRL